MFDEWLCLLFWMIFMLNDDFIFIHMLWDTYVTALVFTMPKAHISDRGSNLSVPGRQHLFPLFFAFIWSLLLQQRSVLIWNASLPQKFPLSLSHEWKDMASLPQQMVWLVESFFMMTSLLQQRFVKGEYVWFPQHREFGTLFMLCTTP